MTTPASRNSSGSPLTDALQSAVCYETDVLEAFGHGDYAHSEERLQRELQNAYDHARKLEAAVSERGEWLSVNDLPPNFYTDERGHECPCRILTLSITNQVDIAYVRHVQILRNESRASGEECFYKGWKSLPTAPSNERSGS